jgi:phosphogluconate dehydratase
LLSREVIAMSAAIGLSHNMFDGALYLGVCDKIVPGLTMAALSFGHLPSVFIPSGPMASGLPNKERSAFASCTRKVKWIVWRCWSPKPPLTTRREPVLLRYGEHQPDGG